MLEKEKIRQGRNGAYLHGMEMGLLLVWVNSEII